jgi:hypothetical protein
MLLYSNADVIRPLPKREMRGPGLLEDAHVVVFTGC